MEIKNKYNFDSVVFYPSAHLDKVNQAKVNLVSVDNEGNVLYGTDFPSNNILESDIRDNFEDARDNLVEVIEEQKKLGIEALDEKIAEFKKASKKKLLQKSDTV